MIRKRTGLHIENILFCEMNWVITFFPSCITCFSARTLNGPSSAITKSCIIKLTEGMRWGEERVVGVNNPAAGIRTEGPDLEMPTGITSYLLSWSFWSSIKNLKSPETHWREGKEPANTLESSATRCAIFLISMMCSQKKNVSPEDSPAPLAFENRPIALGVLPVKIAELL